MFGMSYFNLEKIDSAEIYFKKALKMDSKNPKILYRLATLEYQRENFKIARLLAMQSIMYSKPDHDKQYMLLGIMAKNEFNYKSAVNYFDEAVKNNSTNVDALFELAFAADSYYEDKKIALKYYERFIEIFESKNLKLSKYASERIKQLRKQLFMDGVIVD